MGQTRMRLDASSARERISFQPVIVTIPNVSSQPGPHGLSYARKGVTITGISLNTIYIGKKLN